MTTFGIQLGQVHERRVDVVIVLNGRRVEFRATDEVNVFLELARLALFAVDRAQGQPSAQLEARGHLLRLSEESGPMMLTLENVGPDGVTTEVATDVIEPVTFAKSIWRALCGPERDLKQEMAGLLWHHAFPAAEMTALWQAIRPARPKVEPYSFIKLLSLGGFFLAIALFVFAPQCSKNADGNIVIKVPLFGSAE